MLDDAIRYRLLKLVADRPDISQREIAQEMGVSLGRVNYCLKAMVEKGWLKIGNFRRNRDKRRYSYLLTPRGIKEKSQVTARFLMTKMNEYDALRAEIDRLRTEVREQKTDNARNT